ncbi:hypothetical protein STEG23_014286, partial [Scotinomys teguina]
MNTPQLWVPAQDLHQREPTDMGSDYEAKCEVLMRANSVLSRTDIYHDFQVGIFLSLPPTIRSDSSHPLSLRHETCTKTSSDLQTVTFHREPLHLKGLEVRTLVRTLMLCPFRAGLPSSLKLFWKHPPRHNCGPIVIDACKLAQVERIGLHRIGFVSHWLQHSREQVRELPLPLTSCSTWESKPGTLPGHHSRADPIDGGADEPALRMSGMSLGNLKLTLGSVDKMTRDEPK